MIVSFGSRLPSEEAIAESHEIDFSALSLPEIIKTPRYQENLRKIKGISKTELHAHLGGAIPLDFIRQHSLGQDYVEIEGLINKIKNGIDYSEGFKVFSLISKVLTTNQRMEEAAFEFCRSQFLDNVTFSELRTGLKRLDGSFEEYLAAVIRGLKKGMQAYPVKVNLLLSVRRDTSNEDANETIDLAIKYREQGITGIDVSGESTKGDGSGIFTPLKRARKSGLPVTLHIGENRLERPEQQMRELTEIQPSRLGHAVHLCPEAREWMMINQTPVEACLISALSMGMINKPSDHPAISLFKMGHPVLFCSDDFTLFGDLSDQLALVACLCNLSMEEVVEHQLKSLKYAFS